MSTPRLSIIVIAYDMPRQALNTLISLSPAYQQRVDADDYEVIVVENRSARNMDEEAIAALPGQFRYFLRNEKGVSPAPAINFGIAQAKGKFIGLMIDGARMVSPGVVHHALMTFTMTPDALVLVPGYHLGEDEQQFNLSSGYDEAKEQSLLEEIDWWNDGYRLFDISCLSQANPHGIFHPFMECNCLFVHADILADIGGANEQFDMAGGGSLNLYMYRLLAIHPRTDAFVLPGEGSFHQFHGGVTTSEIEGRDELLAAQSAQLNRLLGHNFRAPKIQPTLLGKMHGPALRYLQHSVDRGIARVQRFASEGRELYDDDVRKREGASPSKN